MLGSEAILEQWFRQTLESYPAVTAQFIAGEKDPFRNPVRNTLRTAMESLLAELQGEMDARKVRCALDSIIRIRAVQDFSPSQAVGFVFLLRPLLLTASAQRPAMLQSRIDQLALMAFDVYMECREQIKEIRVRESRRATAFRRP